ncbi:MAG TPA: adenylyl-sulfate kinase [Thiolapillus brandeum]|uniref:Adenylyl-sulfate kinase n=1 Tax=Thiolapillus brandeum TaxID=1076588 RepID=A0A831JWM9_9GAMM|nr:adenylyl-sulfate kinase [Thiolapillus brandeum]
MDDKTENVIWHQAKVTREQRQNLNGHQSFVLWFTGLSGSGKSTLANAVEEYLHQMQCRTFVFDGDNVRHGLCSDLGFSEDDRRENIRRIGEMTHLFVEAGVIAMTAFISPFRAERQRVRDLFNPGEFIEVYCECSLETCEERDVKGLYAKARAGLIPNYTGISSPYEAPEAPEIAVNTDTQTLQKSVEQVLNYLRDRKLID